MGSLLMLFGLCIGLVSMDSGSIPAAIVAAASVAVGAAVYLGSC